MCGLLAIATHEPGAAPDLGDPRVARALDRLDRRGPDARGVSRDGRGAVLLAHTRLAIVDPSDRGSQPMCHGPTGLTITYTGEIYNAPELRRELADAGERFRSECDTEVLLAALAAWGPAAALDRVRGMFAFVCWDPRARTLTAAVDHAGIKPLVYREHGRGIDIASDLDALRAASADALELDADALADALCRGFIAPPRTVWKTARRLAPGGVLTWRPGSVARVARWWSPPTSAGAAPVGVDEAEALIGASVARHLLADVPLGLLLSAGLDSTVVAAAAARLGRRDLRCVTLGLPGEHNESADAARNAAALGLDHTARTLRPRDFRGTLADAAHALDEPQAYGAVLTMTAVARAARRHAKSFLAGDGGDELLAGYAWHADEPTSSSQAPRPPSAGGVADPFAATPGQRWRALDALARSGFHADYQLRVFPRFHPDEARALLAPLGCAYTADDLLAPVRDADAPDMPWPRRAQRIDLLNFCAGSILAKVDRASMHHSLEIRVPLLDRDLLERFLSARPDPDRPTDKPLLRALLRPTIGDAAVERPKQGFSLRLLGADGWAAERVRLRDSALGRSGILDPRWPAMLSDGAPYQDGRTFALVFLDAWLAPRLGG